LDLPGIEEQTGFLTAEVGLVYGVVPVLVAADGLDMIRAECSTRAWWTCYQSVRFTKTM
jgi:hypothetical protein